MGFVSPKDISLGGPVWKWPTVHQVKVNEYGETEWIWWKW